MSRRERHHSDWKAESTWRRHEISGRLKALQSHMDDKHFREILDRVDKVLRDVNLPLTVRKKLEASLTFEHEPLPEDEKDKELTP